MCTDMVGVRGEGARGGGHLIDYEKGLEKSHMTKHWLSCHRGEEKPKFGVKIIKSFTSCMVRQLWECIRIRRRLQEQAKGNVRLLNSKSEYSRCSLPRLVVEGTEGIEGDDKKEGEGEHHVNDREVEPPPVRSETNSGLSLKEDKKGAKTNGQEYRTSDIRSHFKKQTSDRGVT